MGRHGTGQKPQERTLPVGDTGPNGNLEKKVLKRQDTQPLARSPTQTTQLDAPTAVQTLHVLDW